MRTSIMAAVIAIAVISSPATAQPAQPEKTFTLTLKASDVDKIGTALAAQPYKDVAQLLAILNEQVQKQLQPPEPAKTEPEPVAPKPKK